MAAFPVPPPLKEKPLPPKMVNQEVAHPERLMRIVLVSGAMGAVFALFCGGALYFFLRASLFQWNVPPIVVPIAFILVGWTGFIGGVRSGQRVVTQLLHAEHAEPSRARDARP